MTDLKQLLATNIKRNRHRLGISQAKLAEKAESSTQYISMIELGRKFPSVEMLGKLASALEIDNLDLFSPPPFPEAGLRKLQNEVLSDIERAVSKAVGKVAKEAVSSVLAKYSLEVNPDDGTAGGKT